MIDQFIILRVNAETKEVKTEPLSGSELLSAGRGFIANTLLNEVETSCDPLGPQNKLIFATGIMPDSRISGSSRLSVGAKSPLTFGIKEANSGGQAALALARLGIRAIIMEGAGDPGNILVISRERCRIEDGREFLGLGNYALVEGLFERYGTKKCIISIGIAGEYGLPIAGIAVTDREGYPGRFAARGGLGAVMGSKGIKAIVIDMSSEVGTFGDSPEFRAARKRYVAAIKNTPLTGEALPKYGTNFIYGPLSALGAVPVKNFSLGSFERGQKIDGEALHRTIASRGGKGQSSHSCSTGCVVRCSNVYVDEEGSIVVSPIEYETIALLGANLGIDSLDEIAKLNYICNDLGVDTIEVGGGIGVAMEEGYYSFGDFKAIEAILGEIKKGSILGRVFGQGTYGAGKILGARRIPAVKRQGMPGYDPRGIKGIGVTMASSPMGADHTAGHTFAADVNHQARDGQVEISRSAQIRRAMYDSLGWCIFHEAPTIDDLGLISDLIECVYGKDLSPEQMLSIGARTLSREIEFNRAAGITLQDDRLPKFFSEERLANFGTIYDLSDEELERTLVDLEN